MHEEKRDESRVRLVRNHRRRIWKRVVSILACIVVFCTTYALILPAITLEKSAQSGKTGETQAESRAVPVCTFESLGIHKHTAACRDKEGNYVCGYSDFVAHTHDEKCYDENGKLWCPFPEIKLHTHSESCYAAQETEPVHTHTDKCYAEKQGKLTCTIPEGKGAHSHSEDCYDKNGKLICKTEESAGHQHTEKCYAKSKVLVCKLSTEPAVQEAQKKLVCGKEEIILHEHEEKCFDKDGNLICDKTQVLEHQHSDACFEIVKETEDSGKKTADSEKGTADSEKETADSKKETADTKKPAASIKQDAKGQSSLKLQAGADSLKTLENGQGGETEAQQNQQTRSVQALPVTSITGSGTQYDAANDKFTTELGIEFKFNKNEITDGAEYVFNYPEKVLVPENLIGQEKPLYDDDGKPAGTYTFEKNGDDTYSVRVKLDDTYVHDAGEKISGHIEFKGSLDCSTNDNGEIKIPVDESGLEIKIPSEEITYPKEESDKYGIDVTKSGEYKSDGQKLSYTIYVRSHKGTPNPINFEDVLKATCVELGSPEVKVEQGTYQRHSQWDWRDNNDWKVISVTPNCQNGTISMQLPGLAKGEDKAGYIEANCYRITYTYDLSGQNIIQMSADNKVKLNAKDEKSGQEVEDEASKSINIDKRLTTFKEGTYNEKEKRIEWKITINANKVDIADALLTDDMLGQISEGTGVTLNPSSGYDIETDKQGKITGIRFMGYDGGTKNENQYTITYYTDAEKEWEEHEIRNTVKFDPTPDEPGNKDEVTGEKEVTIPATQITKDHGEMTFSEDEKTAEISWTITVEVPKSGIPADTAIKDQVVKEYSDTSKDQWLTWAQIQEMVNSMHWTDDNGKIGPGVKINTTDIILTLKEPIGEKSQVNYQDVLTDQKLMEGKFTAFEIKLPNNLEAPSEDYNKISCVYKTTVDLEKATGDKTTYGNYIEVGGKNKDSKLEYYKGGLVKTDGNNQTGTTNTSSDGTLTWKVKATISSKDNQWLQVIDTLPEGVVLDSISLSGETTMDLSISEDNAISGSNDKYQVNGQYNTETRAITLTMSNKNQDGLLPSNKEFVFTIICQADGEKLEGYEPGKKYTFTNEATAQTDQGELGSSQQTQDWAYEQHVEEKKVVTKAGHWDNDSRRLDYSIVINPEGKDLVEGTDILTLTDKLKYNSKLYFDYPAKYQAKLTAALIQSSVKLYYAVPSGEDQWTMGEEIRNWSWTYDSKTEEDYHGTTNATITATGIPDKTPLILKYAYSLDSTIRDGDSCNLPVSNIASLEGTTHSGSDDRGQDKWEEQSSSGGITTDKKYTFYKVEKGNYGKGLSGAEFSIYQYDPESNVYGENAVKIYITAIESSGKFEIKWKDGGYQYNTLYKVIETKAPDGYELPKPVQEFYFYFSNQTDTTHALPENLPKSAVDLSETSHTVYVENVSSIADITVNKIWRNSYGHEITHNEGSITLELYQKASTVQGDSGGDSGGSTDDSKTATLTGKVKLGDAVNGNEWLDFSTSGNRYLPGTTLTFCITDKYGDKSLSTLLFNNVSLVPSKKDTTKIKEEGGWEHDVVTYTYSVTLEDGENVLAGFVPSWNITDWGWSPFTVTTPGTLFDTITISVHEDWKHTFTDLPLFGKTEDGSTIYYSYYVSEIEATNYTTTYENNDGITSGEIKVINTAQDVPTYELPETGGPGTSTYTIGGLLLTLAGLLLLYKRKKCGKEDVASF